MSVAPSTYCLKAGCRSRQIRGGGPSAYNNYVKQRIISLKQEQHDTPAKELLGIAAAEWKTLTDEEKAGYKSS